MRAAHPVMLDLTRSGGSGVRIERLRTTPGHFVEYHPLDALVSVATGKPRLVDLITGEGTRRLVILPGHVHVIPAGASVTVRLLGEAENVVTALSPGLLARVGGDGMHLRPTFGADAPLLKELVLALERSGTEAETRRRHVDHLAIALASQLVQEFGIEQQRPAPRARRNGPLVEAVAEYIDTHLDQQLTLSELAGKAHLSVFSFARRFRTVVGLPPHQYVLKRRVERAKALLVESEVGIAEVALRCGFGDQSSFSTAFRRFTRQTPTGYRDSHRNHVPSG